MSDEVGENSKNTPGIVSRRRNGFEQPFDPLQICTWCLFPLILTHYYAFLYFLLWNEISVKIVLTCLFTVFAVLSIVSVVCTCIVDPADDALCRQPVKIPEGQTSDEQIYCYLCEIHVHNSSKHCRYCDKCVKKFDHHCKWLNTCIGEKNYVYFLLIVLFVFLLTLESLAISLALMIESFITPNQFHHRVMDIRRFSHFLGSDLSVVALQTILVVSVFVLLILALMLVQLGGFHIMLLWRGLTTYDFIILEQKRLREAEAERLKKHAEKQQQRDKSDQAIVAQARSSTAIADNQNQAVRPIEQSGNDNNLSRYSSHELELVESSLPEEKV